jgi:hypothetical protein
MFGSRLIFGSHFRSTKGRARRGGKLSHCRGVLNERALGIGRLIHVAQIRDARALDGKLML